MYDAIMSLSKVKPQDQMQSRASLTRFAWLSIGAAVATISLKTIAYFLTGSVGLLSDAIESLVNLAGAVMALIMLTIAARPADDESSPNLCGHLAIQPCDRATCDGHTGQPEVPALRGE